MTALSYSRRDTAPIFAALAITFLLFWMDEGYYDLRWMSNSGNWIMFILYSGGFVAGQYMVSELFFKRMQGRKGTVLTILSGIPLGFTIVLLALYAISALFRVLS